MISCENTNVRMFRIQVMCETGTLPSPSATLRCGHSHQNQRGPSLHRVSAVGSCDLESVPVNVEGALHS